MFAQWKIVMLGTTTILLQIYHSKEKIKGVAEATLDFLAYGGIRQQKPR
jgi:hypothetical protein